MVAAGAALRAVGNFKAGMVVSRLVIVNMVLATFLIFGWVTGRAFGLRAGDSSLVAVVVAVIWFARTSCERTHTSIRAGRSEATTRALAEDAGDRAAAGFEFAMMGVYLMSSTRLRDVWRGGAGRLWNGTA